MMKKLIALLLTLTMLSTVTAVFAEDFIEDTEAEALPCVLTVRVTDGSNTPVAGAVLHFLGTDVPADDVTDSDGMWSAELDAGAYTLRATDPADGYSVQQLIVLEEDMQVDLVIRRFQPGTHAKIATLTKPQGVFATDLFGNNTSDIDIRAVLHGYSTVAFDRSASYGVNTTAVTMDPGETQYGNKTYRFHVQPGLTYSDGSAITARDYVFSVLLQTCPAVKELGGAAAYTALAGHDAWEDGSAQVFEGVRLIDEDTFALTISGDALPYFYELTYVNVTPYPMAVIAPGCDVADDGEGAYFTGAVTAELLRGTLTDTVTGYLYNPAVSSGPYKLVSRDLEAGTVELTANTAFIGNEEGTRPVIENLTLVTMDAGEALQALKDGSIDIINKVTDINVADEGSAANEDGVISMRNYLRSGLGFLGFACEDGPTAEADVRMAIAYAMDQDTFVTEYTGNYGLPAYSWYGLGQWMAADYLGTMADYTAQYPLDLDRARQLLIRAGYTSAADGSRYNGEGVRCRKLDKNEADAYRAADSHVIEAIEVGSELLMPLTIRLARVEGARSMEVLQSTLLDNLAALGFGVEFVTMDQADLMAMYYRRIPRTCNAFLMGTNFNMVYDPADSFNGDARYQGTVNTTGINDAKLLKDAQTLRATEPGDTAAYVQRWLTLMDTYSRVLPTLPIYTNIYFDFFSNALQDYEPNGNWSWGRAILYTWIAE